MSFPFFKRLKTGTQLSPKIKITAVVLMSFFLLFTLFYLRAVHESRQARFNTDVLERFLRSFRMVEGKQVRFLAELPDFHIISSYDSLSVKGKDLRKQILAGYVYDLTTFPDGRYVISASPVSWVSSGVEFGITDQGELKFNNKTIDPEADSYEEVSGWTKIPRIERPRTAELPEYLED